MRRVSVSAVGADGQGHLTVDIRADRAVLRLQSADVGGVTGRDIRLAQRFRRRWRHRDGGRRRRAEAEALEIAIDALDIGLVRPFWKAIMGYADEPGSELPAALIDPSGPRARGLVPADGCASAAAQSHPHRRRRARRRGRGADRRGPRRRAAAARPTMRRRRIGCWPIPRETKHASAPGRDGIDVTTNKHEAPEPPEPCGTGSVTRSLRARCYSGSACCCSSSPSSCPTSAPFIPRRRTGYLSPLWHPTSRRGRSSISSTRWSGQPVVASAVTHED